MKCLIFSQWLWAHKNIKGLPTAALHGNMGPKVRSQLLQGQHTDLCSQEVSVRWWNFIHCLWIERSSIPHYLEEFFSRNDWQETSDLRFTLERRRSLERRPDIRRSRSPVMRPYEGKTKTNALFLIFNFVFSLRTLSPG